MSLALLSESQGAKRQRCGELEYSTTRGFDLFSASSTPVQSGRSSPVHVHIPMPNQMITVGYFGSAIPDGGEVTTEQWEAFVRTYVAQRLGSFTLSEAIGYWKGCRERTFVLTVIHTRADDVSEDVAAIAKLYKTQFRQEAVLVNSVHTSPVLV